MQFSHKPAESWRDESHISDETASDDLEQEAVILPENLVPEN